VPASFVEKTKPETLRLTSGETNYLAPTWKKDGSELIATHARRPEHTEIEYWYDLVRVDARPAQVAHEVLPIYATKFNHIHPVVSPDGKWVAFMRRDAEQPEFHDNILCIAPIEGGAVIELTASLDRSVEQIVWSRDSLSLFFMLLSNGTSNLYRAHIENRAIEQLTDRQQDITSFDVDQDGRLIFAASTPADPSALYMRENDGSIVTLSKPNAGFLQEHFVCSVEEMRHPSDAYAIQGWVIKPPDFDPAKKYPLALEIHGGPSAMWTAATRSMWHEWQILAQHGYVVYFCNPRGSDGYGQAFLEANRADWGDGPMHDILRGVDQLVAQGYIDTDRMALTGGSYGGYLTAWIIGRDHRFKAAVAQRGVYNLISMRGTTDIPYFNDRESGTTPWQDVGALWRMSPVALAPLVQTPLLMEHSEQDYRVPISQAEELYLALRTFKKEVELIRWPREGHELSRGGEPKHRVERIKRIIQWFDRFTYKS
jgi:dipeptidyl aminopeptidase/acylaminoacyl peptidase